MTSESRVYDLMTSFTATGKFRSCGRCWRVFRTEVMMKTSEGDEDENDDDVLE